ncbi:MAG: NAD-dependent epimerase/dehydratase family protein [Rhodospirillales bacterium]|nr:NAD-dependent epimerase/dehydratase family protein [Rhodospirillales bacterium]
MNSPDPKILVTGASGFIGRHVVQELTAINKNVLRLDFHKETSSDSFYRAVDLLNTSSLPSLPTSIETIYHFAGQIWGDEENEAIILKNVISLAQKCSAKRIVYASTCAVYGQNAMDRAVDEDVQASPMSPYANGKLLGEERLKKLTESSDINATILRYFNPYGPGQFTKMAVPSMVAKALAGDIIEIFGDGEQVRDFIYVEDMAKATIAATQVGGEFEVFNIGSGRELSVNQLANQIIETTKSTSTIERSPIPQARQNLEVHYRVADIGKITSLSDWQSETSLSDGLKRLLSNS